MDAATEHAAQSHYCACTKGEITMEECFGISSSPHKNRDFCKKSSCMSPGRVCLSCASHDEVDLKSVVVRPGAGLCEFHERNGYKTRRDEDPDEARSARKAEISALQARVEAKRTAAVKKKGNVRKARERSTPTREATVAASYTVTTQVSVGTMLQELHFSAGKEVVRISCDRIRRFKGQIRKEFDPKRLNDLTESIAEVGQIVPGIVRRIEGDPEHDYELIAGERRWIACGRAGVDFTAVISDVVNHAQQFAIGAIENIGREPNSPVEIAGAAEEMHRDMGWSFDKIATALNMSRGYLDQHRNLLKLHPEVQALMSRLRPKSEQLQIGTANSLTKFPLDQQLKHALKILEQGLRTDVARRYLAQEAGKIGIEVKKRKRSPYNLHRDFMSFVERTHVKAETYLELDSSGLRRMFHGRSSGDLRATKNRINDLIKKLETVRDRF